MRNIELTICTYIFLYILSNPGCVICLKTQFLDLGFFTYCKIGKKGRMFRELLADFCANLFQIRTDVSVKSVILFSYQTHARTEAREFRKQHLTGLTGHQNENVYGRKYRVLGKYCPVSLFAKVSIVFLLCPIERPEIICPHSEDTVQMYSSMRTQ